MNLKKPAILQPLFVGSALYKEQFPILKAPSGKAAKEIAIVGKSNVGKSSLINFLLSRKLARVSSTPGKTKILNFFCLDEQLVLVDLPGYGFAKVSKEIKNQWAPVIDHYFQKRDSLALVLLLLDIRRDSPTEQDIAFLQMTIHQKIPVLLVFTKCDKVKESQRVQNVHEHLSILEKEVHVSFPFASVSILDAKSRVHLRKTIDELISK